MKKRNILFLITFLIIVIIIQFNLGYSFISSLNKNDKEPKYTIIKPKLYFEIKKFEVLNNNIYLALNGSKEIKYTLETNSNYEEKLTFTSNNENIVTVNELGVITAKGVGNTTIDLKIKDEIRTINITVTDLIEIMPQNYNKQKKLLTCERYNEEENNLLDAILANRVEEAGVSTRAGVVAAARFITLEFPYRIGYFSENGRLTTYGYSYYVDGEGRYYHKGLYLHKSRFKNIEKSMYGPNIWGCGIYSYVSEGYRRNGFDCSGFIAWVLLNGGFDSGDIGAGISNIITDMTDLGAKISLSESLKNKSIKTGDLLSGPNNNGGHIAMVIGQEDDKYYVAECLWGNGDYEAIIKTYTAKNIKNYFKWHINMDNFYLNDGNYTEHWI